MSNKAAERTLVKHLLKEIIFLTLSFYAILLSLFLISLIFFWVDLAFSDFLGFYLIFFGLADFIIFYIYHFIRGSKFFYLEREGFIRLKKSWIFLIALPALYFGLNLGLIVLHDIIYYTIFGDIYSYLLPIISALTIFLAALIPTLITWQDYKLFCLQQETAETKYYNI